MGFLDTSGVQYLWTKIKGFLDGKVSNTRTINGKALNANITLTADDVNAISSSLVGVANGVATLDANGKVLTSQLPSSIDEILEYEKLSVFPSTGEASKIYVDKTTNKTYRWGGSEYVEISASLAIGSTSSTAGRGDLTQTAYDHSQSAHAPYNAEANVQSDWNVTDTTSDAFIKNKPTTMRANGGNADTVNGYTVNSNVPSGAKFTDTTYSNATTSAAGLMSAEDKVKLNGITGTGSYVLPTASSSTLGGVKTTSTVTSTSGLTAVPIIDGVPYYKDTNTTYNAATTSAAGLMSADDKAKLNGIASGANAYSLPTASSSTLGGVKTTSSVTSTSGLTACPIIGGVPYYKDSNTTYSAITNAEIDAIFTD